MKFDAFTSITTICSRKEDLKKIEHGYEHAQE